ncbi:M23 family metallopeptidase [Sulfurospirillum sp. 1612]|uniref:M23 family metallopeptidase n=1 Tax=Sulfurospirillum sp. 1612 TaxID=3094835 RepID=UPI002F956EC7
MINNRRFHQRRGSTGIVIAVILIVIIAGLGYLYNAPMFERNAPKIHIASKIDWNLQKPLQLGVSDDSGIKFIRVTLSDGKNSVSILKKVYTKIEKNQNLEITFPRTGFTSTKKNFSLQIQVTDASKWNFFSGNSAEKTVSIIVDRTRPEVYVIDNSYKITRGGSALVVFKATDNNIKDLYIVTNFGKKFYPTPFYKEGYYISLLAWPVQEKNFSATIVATDYAGNSSKSRVRLFLKDKKYKLSHITLKDNFLDGKISNLISNIMPELNNASKVEKFKAINEKLREVNEKNIDNATNKTETSRISNFTLKPFYPLRNSAAVASFGDHRYYSYGGQQISEAYHLGIDLASVRFANIRSKNPGTVVFAQPNGIYGNNLIISHGLGLYTLYGHCSRFLVQVGDHIKPNEIIAKTGSTGLALGDHLHFGVLVQGIEVRPEEWMDKSWMKTNIFAIISVSKKMIDKN